MQLPKDFIRGREIGEYKITLPEPPDKKKIANWDKPIKEQKFVRTELPTNFKSLQDAQKRDFIKNEWDKRLNGYWFYNNGNIEYITGTHYFYINWWKIGTLYPIFIDADRDYYYVWDMCAKDKRCDGLLYISNRGEGKTEKAMCIVYETISRKESVQGGIQSKTEPDARKIFSKIVRSWRYLPYFFRPIDVGVSRPAKILEFFEPSERTTKSQDKSESNALNSFIDFRSSEPLAYDGDTVHIIFHDEVGKTVDIDVDYRMGIARECLRAGLSKYGRGKIIATSTVEEMEKMGGKNCRKIWDKADITQREKDGSVFTKNGLYRLFKPADYGYIEIIDGERFIDDYGYSLRDKAKEYFLNKRKNLKGADLNSEKRKYPLEVKDIWVSDTKNATYDVIKIQQQLDFNQTVPDTIIEIGNYVWQGGKEDTMVEWHPCENGRWEKLWHPLQKDSNRYTLIQGQRVPANTDIGCFGLDPYDNKTTVDDRKSKAASYGLRKFDPLNPHETGIFITKYLNRPELPEIMWEDMIKQCVYFGWEILVESNKIGTINHFRRRGYERYLMCRPEETQTEFSKKMEEPGIPMSGEDARQALIYATESYIINNVGLVEREGEEPRMGRCYFDDLLYDWMEFDFEQKWTKFDSMVGAGLAILGSRKFIMQKPKSQPSTFFPITGTINQRRKPTHNGREIEAN